MARFNGHIGEAVRAPAIDPDRKKPAGLWKRRHAWRPVGPAGTFSHEGGFFNPHGGKRQLRERDMHGLIYLIGLIVVILFILSLFGLR
jgi:hypothetical protein